jgi:hypothetical protein
MEVNMNNKRVIIFALTLLALVGACSKIDRLGPDSDSLPPASERLVDEQAQTEPADAKSGGFGLGRDLRLAVDEGEKGKAQKQIGQSGGTLDIPVYTFTDHLVIPGQALDSTVTIAVETMRGRNVRNELLTEYDFQPDGLQFNRQAILQHRLTAPEGQVIELWWYDQNSSTWIRIEQQNAPGGARGYF